MEHAVPRRRGHVAPNLQILRRWRRADVVAIRPPEGEADLRRPEVNPAEQRYYELGCLPPRRGRAAG